MHVTTVEDIDDAAKLLKSLLPGCAIFVEYKCVLHITDFEVYEYMVSIVNGDNCDLYKGDTLVDVVNLTLSENAEYINKSHT